MPEGVTVQVEGPVVIVKGPQGELRRRIPGHIVTTVQDGEITLGVKNGTKREKKLVFTYVAHIKNMMKGVQEPFVYKLKVCSSHFPITASVSGDVFSVKNYLGEKVPRTMKIKGDAKVTVSGSDVTVESIDIEVAGRVAAAIESLVRICDKDRRIFQDGIYIYEKAGKQVSS